MKCKMIFATLSVAALSVAAAFEPVDVLVYTRWRYVKNQQTGEVSAKGAFRHESTGQGAEEVRRYFTANGLSCLVTDNPAFFVSDAMKRLKLVVLCNANHELFATTAEREAFYAWVKNGGGVLATHSSLACERGAKRFRELLGGSFERHEEKHRPVPFAKSDRTHPAMACMPENYVWEDDEIYINRVDRKNIRPLLVMDMPGRGEVVLEWCKSYGKGRVYCTALGHNPGDWGKMEWQLHLLEAARWAMETRPDTVCAKPSKATARCTIDGVECVKDGAVLWRFCIANRESKPFVHPLSLPDGRCVTDLRPADHPWHLGLWFCWKYINGVNYWEPRDPAQSNLFPDGMTVVKDFKISPAGGACDVELELWYGPRAEPGKILLEEHREMSFSEPNAKGAYKIRSTHIFTARSDIKLDCRRPVGYGGFSLRMSSMMRNFKMSGVGGEPSAVKNIGGPKGMTAVRYVDGGSGHGIEIKMSAPHALERIYTWSDHRFVNPMPIYDAPLELKAGESFKLDYELSVF